jgi:hypothetical protein
MVDVECLLNPTLTSAACMSLYWPVADMSPPPVPSEEVAKKELKAVFPQSDAMPLSGDRIDHETLKVAVMSKEVEEEEAKKENNVQFRPPSLIKARNTRQEWQQRAKEMKEKVDVFLQAGTLSVAKVLRRVPQTFFQADAEHKLKFAQNTLYYQLILMSLRDEIQLEMPVDRRDSEAFPKLWCQRSRRRFSTPCPCPLVQQARSARSSTSPSQRCGRTRVCVR